MRTPPRLLVEGAADAGKWETIRRLRCGALLKLFRDRWRYELPNDATGRAALLELVMNLSLAPAADKKVGHAIEIWAPWMQPGEAKEWVSHLNRLDLYERTPTASELGKRLNVTNAERQRLKLWPIKPIDATDEQLAEQTKTRRNEQRRAKLRAKGVRPRGAYLAELKSRPRPWDAKGISRRTWQRRQKRACREVMHDMSRGDAPTIVTKAEHDLATECGVMPKKGHHEGVSVEKPREATKVRDAEANAPRSSDVGHDLATPKGDLARVRAEMEARARDTRFD